MGNFFKTDQRYYTRADVDALLAEQEASLGGDPNTAWTAFTPTVTAAIGTFTAASATARYKRIGTVVHMRFTLTITTVGTGSQPNMTLPFASASTSIGHARENAAVGTHWHCITSGPGVTFLRYDNSGTVASGYQFEGFITFECAPQ